MKWTFVKSLRFRILLMLIAIGIIPAFIATRVVVHSYEDRATTLRAYNVRTQCEILSNQLIEADYFTNHDSEVIGSELTLLSSTSFFSVVLSNRCIPAGIKRTRRFSW
ncbi:MAG: hypothetical protein ACSW8G_08445 [Bacillota bacterium]